MSTIASMLHWAALSVPTVVAPIFASLRRARKSDEIIIAEHRLDASESSVCIEEQSDDNLPTANVDLRQEDLASSLDDLSEHFLAEEQFDATSVRPSAGETTDARETGPKLNAENRPASHPVSRRSSGRPKVVRSHRRSKIESHARSRIKTRPASMW